MLVPPGCQLRVGRHGLYAATNTQCGLFADFHIFHACSYTYNSSAARKSCDVKPVGSCCLDRQIRLIPTKGGLHDERYRPRPTSYAPRPGRSSRPVTMVAVTAHDTVA